MHNRGELPGLPLIADHVGLSNFRCVVLVGASWRRIAPDRCSCPRCNAASIVVLQISGFGWGFVKIANDLGELLDNSFGRVGHPVPILASAEMRRILAAYEAPPLSLCSLPRPLGVLSQLNQKGGYPIAAAAHPTHASQRGPKRQRFASP